MTRTADSVCSECRDLQARAQAGEVDLFGNPTVAPELAPLPEPEIESIPYPADVEVQRTLARTSHKIPEFGVTSQGIKVRIESYGICNGIKGWWVKDIAAHFSKLPTFVPHYQMTRAYRRTGSD